MRIPARTGPLVRLVAGGVAGLLVAVGMFAVLQHLVDVPVTVTRPAVRSATIAEFYAICDCFVPKPWRIRLSRVEIDLPLLHELLTPLTSLVAPVTLTYEPFGPPILIDSRSIE